MKGKQTSAKPAGGAAPGPAQGANAAASKSGAVSSANQSSSAPKAQAVAETKSAKRKRSEDDEEHDRLAAQFGLRSHGFDDLDDDGDDDNDASGDDLDALERDLIGSDDSDDDDIDGAMLDGEKLSQVASKAKSQNADGAGRAISSKAKDTSSKGPKGAATAAVDAVKGSKPGATASKAVTSKAESIVKGGKEGVTGGPSARGAEAPKNSKSGALQAGAVPSKVAYAPVRLDSDSGRGASGIGAVAQPIKGKGKSSLLGDEDEEDAAFTALRAGKKMALPGLDDSDDEEGEGVDDDDEDMDEEGDGEEDEEDEDYDKDEDMDGLDDDEYTGGDFEAAAKRAESKRARIAAEAEAELRLQAAGELEAFTLPTADELEEERAQPPNLPSLKRRIADIITVLTDFRNRRDPLRPRADYVDVLSGDCAEYFGYNRELIDIFMQLFSPGECLSFLEENDKPRPVTIRTNTLKTKRRDLMQALIARGVSVEPIGKWTKVGLKINESNVPIGATPEYLAGHYMLQSAASLVPVQALAPQPGEKVLDMAAAPGGKTSHLAQLMQNTGVLVANDLKKDRLASLTANLARLGVSNAMVVCMDGRAIPSALKGFDRVLLDAPCTGIGVLARDPASRTQKGLNDVQKMSQLQRQLILAAIDACNCESATGGYVVYSTCSMAVEENEAVVNYALRKRHVKIVPFTMEEGEDVGREGLTAYANGSFHPDLKLSRRFYPHVHNMDGFFVCKLKKVANGEKKDNAADDAEETRHRQRHRAEQQEEEEDEDEMDVDEQEDSSEEEEEEVVGRPQHKGGKGKEGQKQPQKPRQQQERAPQPGKPMGKPARAAPVPVPVGGVLHAGATARPTAAAIASVKAANAAVAGEEPEEGARGHNSSKATRLPSELVSAAERQQLHAHMGSQGGKAKGAAPAQPADAASSSGVVSFLKPGESLKGGKKKRKAGRRVKERHELASAARHKAKAGPLGGLPGGAKQSFKKKEQTQ